MKTLSAILIAGTLVGAFIAGSLYGNLKPKAQAQQQITLEKILSIKELHLVRHSYHDLFFLHKHNNSAKPIRAIVQVPVNLTAYLDLRQVTFIKSGDSLRQIILPRATLHNPEYQVDQALVRETRAWQWHVGKDLYPEVMSYLKSALAIRIDTLRNTAIANRILIQAEEEGKAYICDLLQQSGRTDIMVRFSDEL
jgi:Protein of unknown function (DUF4230)